VKPIYEIACNGNLLNGCALYTKFWQKWLDTQEDAIEYLKGIITIYKRKDGSMGLFEAVGRLILVIIYDAIKKRVYKRRFEKGKEYFRSIGLDNSNRNS